MRAVSWDEIITVARDDDTLQQAVFSPIDGAVYAVMGPDAGNEVWPLLEAVGRPVGVMMAAAGVLVANDLLQKK